MVIRIGPLKRIFTPQGSPGVIRTMSTPYDSTSFTNTIRLVKATSLADIRDFVALYVPSCIEIEKKKLKNPDSILSRMKLARERLRINQFQSAAATMSNVEVFKDSKGRVIGGFSYAITGKQMHIGQMVLEPSKRQTKQGLALLLQMARRIKEIAISSKFELIFCDIYKSQESLVNLYKKAGFVQKTRAGHSDIYRLEATPEEFCKNYF